MWEAEGWAWRSQSRTAMAESVSNCFTVPLAWVLFSLSPAFSPTPLCSCWCLSFSLSVPLSLFHLLFFHLTIEMSSLSSMEQGITSQVVWFKPAVHSSCPSNERLLKKNIWPWFWFPITHSLLSPWLSSAHWNSFHLSNRVSWEPFHCSNYN